MCCHGIGTDLFLKLVRHQESETWILRMTELTSSCFEWITDCQMDCLKEVFSPLSLPRMFFHPL